MTILLLLASLAWGQSSSTLQVPLEDQLKLQNVRKDVREILVGRPTITGLPTFNNGIKFGDGTTQTTAASAASVVLATFTVNWANASGTNTSFSGCMPGSTITISGVTASSVAINASAVIDNGSAAANFVHLTVLQDGAFLPGKSSTKAIVAFAQPATAYPVVASIAGYISGGLTAGSHSWCLGVWTSAGTWEYQGASYGSSFSVMEIE